jgi:hypothetical protein
MFNFINETKAIYCSSHKLNGMIDIKNKICNYEECKKISNFNFENERKPIYCFTHKLDGMIDVTHKKCIFEGCKIRPNFNISGEKKGIYCYKHKLDGMIDIKHKMCIHGECIKRPNFNYKNEKEPLYCKTHKLDGMIDIRHPNCKTPLCGTIVTEKYEGYCLYCFINTFPDKPVSRNYKKKEYAVVEFIKNQYPNLTWKIDQIVQDACSKRRPDLHVDLGYQVLIIEIDENQHIDYDNTCEINRINELSNDIHNRPIVFIRFNPDDYVKENVKITSCWGLNKKGISVIKKSKVKEWSDRLNRLKEQIDYWINPMNKTEELIETIQLFYNS